MPKQTGIHKLRGKLGEVSYYRSQVGGDLARSINTAMSERVKNDPAFANTRLNAAEFGGAGKLAGIMVSAVSQRWRYILDPTATGKMSAAIKIAMEQDTTNPWGRREVLLPQMASLQDFYNSLSKNEMLPEIVENLQSAYISDDQTEIGSDGGASLTVDSTNRLLSLGVEGLITTAYIMQANIPHFDPASGKYVAPSRVGIRQIAQVDAKVATGEQVLATDGLEIPLHRGQRLLPQNAANHLGGLLVIMTPYRVVSNQKYIMQEHCSAYFISLPDAE